MTNVLEFKAKKESTIGELIQAFLESIGEDRINSVINSLIVVMDSPDEGLGCCLLAGKGGVSQFEVIGQLDVVKQFFMDAAAYGDD